MKYVTNKMIAQRVLERGWSNVGLTSNDVRDAYEILREEAGNPIALKSDKARSESMSGMSEDRVERISAMIKKLAAE